MAPSKGRHGIKTVNLLAFVVCGAGAFLPGQVDHNQGVTPSTGHIAIARDVVQPHVVLQVNKTKELPMPEVRHFKSAGTGYSEASPLYAKQEKMRDIGGLPVAPVAHHTAPSSIPEVSTSMRCIINLTAQWFLVYTALFIIITLKKYDLAGAREEGYLNSAVETVFFVPMLCVLFLATRLRAVQLAQGDTEKYDLPPWWVKLAMEVCAWSILAETILALAYAMIYGDKLGSITEKRTADTKRKGEWVLLICRYLITLGIYGGFTVVSLGLVIMEGPEELWGDKPPPVNPAMTCIIILSCLYFVVQVALMIARMVNQLVEQQRFGRVKQFHDAVHQVAKREVELAPMLCILFVCARMRAMQIDPVNGNPPRWAQICFYLCTGSIVVQTLLGICSNLFGQKPTVDKEESNSDSAILRVIEFLKWALMALFYGALMIAIISIFRLSIDVAPAHGRVPPLTPSLKCCLFLSTIYFAVYVASEIADTAQKIRDRKGPLQGNSSRLATIKDWLDTTAKDTVGFAPMLCTLFLGTWLRALQITGGTGTPPSWAQTFMYVATWCIPLKLLAHLDKLPKSKGLENILQICQHLCMLVMYSCCVAIIIALFTMTPETANGEGTIEILAPPVS